MADDGRGLTLAQKKAANVWDHIDDVIAALELARAGRWHWTANPRCKYIELRIDMRDGGCLIKNRDGERIDPAALLHQSHTDMHGLQWPTERPALGGWQLQAAADAAQPPQEA